MEKMFESFGAAVKHASQKKQSKSILLGNGFSQSYSDSFSYSSLKEKADPKGLSAEKDEIFARAGSDDFETVIRRLDETLSLIEIYKPHDNALKKTIKDDKTAIKKGLVEALSDIHPNTPDNISDNQYCNTRKFLRNFDSIYTLSYDLLLYWAIMRDQIGDGTFHCYDGFGRDDHGLVWKKGYTAPSRPIYNLHGAMHFYVKNKKLYKLKSEPGRSLLSQLLKNFENGRYPFVVTEGTREDKESRIARSAYLRNCHGTLATLDGALFTHGVALSDNDDHILNKVADSPNLNSVYVGVYGNDLNERDAMETKLKRLSRRHKNIAGSDLEFFYYPSETAGIW